MRDDHALAAFLKRRHFNSANFGLDTTRIKTVCLFTRLEPKGRRSNYSQEDTPRFAILRPARIRLHNIIALIISSDLARLRDGRQFESNIREYAGGGCMQVGSWLRAGVLQSKLFRGNERKVQ
jgi:hypothetical protein